MITRLWAKLVDWWTTTTAMRQLQRGKHSFVGLAALNMAMSELGNGEEGGNNRGAHLERYRGNRGPRGPWCAAFVFWCIWAATRKLGRKCPVKRSHSAKRLFRRCVEAGQLVELDDILPGDVVCWHRGPRGSWKGHIGIVHEVERHNRTVVRWDYTAGNEGPYPAKVAVHEGHRRRLVGFARLP